MKFHLQRQEISQSYTQLLYNERVGGVVSFEGRVRNHSDNRPVASLEYEAYDTLAIKEGEKIVAEALKKYPVVDAFCVHRLGHLKLGEIAVLVVVSADHRGEAFAACQYIIDEVKARVPIWKKEHYTDGDGVALAKAKWVRCDRCAEGHQH